MCMCETGSRKREKEELCPCWFTTENSGFIVCLTTKYSAKDLPSVTLGKQHTASTVPANVYLASVFYRALGLISSANNFKVNVTYILLLWLRACIHTLHCVDCDLSNSTICMQACSTAAGVCVCILYLYICSSSTS